MKGTIINTDQCLLVRVLLEEELKRTHNTERFIECKKLKDYIRSSLGKITVKKEKR